MSPQKLRTLDILFSVVAAAFVVARWFDLLGTAASWTVFAVLAIYTVGTLRWRSPYRKHRSSLHLRAR
jgi:hypothetical protein